MKYAHKNPALSVIHTIISVKLSTFCSILRYQSLLKCTFFYLTFKLFKLLAELIKYFIFHYQAQVTQAWLMNHDCCLQSSVCRQVLLFNINQSLLGWGRWCEYKCVVMRPDNEMILAAARLKQRREIEIINMNEPYLCLMHAREILLLIVLTIHNELTYLFLQSWYRQLSSLTGVNVTRF